MASSRQSLEDALRLLAPFKVRGYSVSSDSAGLTKLSAQKNLIEILAIIDQPKQIVHGIGAAIGGQGVGVWAADNTQMFYPTSVGGGDLLSALLTIQDEVDKQCQIKIGLGAHYGEFYSIKDRTGQGAVGKALPEPSGEGSGDHGRIRRDDILGFRRRHSRIRRLGIARRWGRASTDTATTNPGRTWGTLY